MKTPENLIPPNKTRGAGSCASYPPKLRLILPTRSRVNLVLGRTLPTRALSENCIQCFPLNTIRTNQRILSFSRRPKIPLEPGGYSRERNHAFRYKRKQKRKEKKKARPSCRWERQFQPSGMRVMRIHTYRMTAKLFACQQWKRWGMAHGEEIAR